MSPLGPAEWDPVTPARLAAKNTSASYWLCARHRNWMFSTVAPDQPMKLGHELCI